MKRKSVIVGAVALVAVGAWLTYSRTAHKGGPSATAGPAGQVRRVRQTQPLDEDYFRPHPIGRPLEGLPWITDLLICDLDQDGLKDVLVADGRLNKVTWIRQVSPGKFEEQDIGGPIQGPAHLEAADLRGTGHLDVLVASMGIIFPDNDKIGSVVILENDGKNHFTNHVLLDKVAWVTYVQAARLTKHSVLPDLVVGQFGYLEGEIRWMENMGNGTYKSHQLLDLPGTIHAPVADMHGDGNMDIVALVSKKVEEVHMFTGDGQGNFRDQVIHGSTNQDYGSSGLTIADVNQDGRPDVIFTNGDGFSYATPGPRPWHGVHWLENMGGGKFTYHKVGDFSGAFSPIAVDLRGSGHMDIVATSCFNDWNDKDAVSLMAFENDGHEHFTPRILARAPTHLVVVKAADMFNDGRIELVTGSFAFYPPYNHVSRVTLWEHNE